jgi:hypothetical protein
MSDLMTTGWDPTVGGAINFNDVDENAGFSVVPKGNYLAICEEATYGDSNSGWPMITLRFKIQDPDHPNEGGEEETVNGRTVSYWILLNHEKPDVRKQGLAQLKKAVVSMCPDLIETPFEPKEAASWFKGRSARISTVVRKGNNGRGPMANIQEIMPADGPEGSDGAGFFGAGS